MARWIAILLIAVVSAQSSLAWAFPCVESDCCGEPDAGDPAGEDEEGGCSCPLPCHPCCTANLPPVLLPSVPTIVLPLVPALCILLPDPERQPEPSIFRKILHVPKALAA